MSNIKWEPYSNRLKGDKNILKTFESTLNNEILDDYNNNKGNITNGRNIKSIDSTGYELTRRISVVWSEIIILEVGFKDIFDNELSYRISSLLVSIISSHKISLLVPLSIQWKYLCVSKKIAWDNIKMIT